MVDVEIGVPAKPVDDKVDEALERGFLLDTGQRPFRAMSLATIVGLEAVAEEIFKPTLAHKRIAFEVEENIALRWFGETREATPVCDGQCLEDDPPRSAPLNLNTSLLPDALIRGHGSTIRFPCKREGFARESRYGPDITLFQLVCLELCDPSYQAEMIVRAPPLLAALPPPANSQYSTGSG